MSTYDDASLVLVPSGYKNGVVFSQKPMDANGQLTFTRASGATRVGPNGYIEKVRTNLLTYSQDFSDSSWVVPTTLTKTTGQTDPNGGTTALLVQNISDGNGYFAKGLTLTANVPHTASIYIKGASSGSVSIRIDDSTTGPQYNINYTTSWQRFSVTRTPNQTGCSFIIGGYGTWDVGTDIYFAFAQAETGDIATDYIATTTAAVSVGPVSGTPRLDYLGSDCPRLLLEPAATALNTKSEDINGWQNAGGTSSANTTETLDPSGYYGADIMNESCVRYFSESISSATYTFSCFAKAKTGTDFILRIDTPTTISALFNLSTGAISGVSAGITPQIQNYGNGWWRCAITFTQPIVNYVVQTGPTSKCYVWGANLVQAAYATSYIPTLGTSVTRVADAASKTGISSLIGQTEGVIYWEFNVPAEVLNTTSYYLQISTNDGTSSNQISIVYYNTGRIQFVVFAGGSLEVNINLSSYGLTAGNHKFAFAYKLNDYVAYVDGVSVGTDTSAPVPATSKLELYDTSGGVNVIKQILLFKTRLTNAQLAELTTL
jgi:hypothetical protein